MLKSSYWRFIALHKFLLTPKPSELSNKAWALSWYCGRFETVATDADQARAIAAGQFTVALHPGGHLPLQSSPWFDPQLVSVELITA